MKQSKTVKTMQNRDEACEATRKTFEKIRTVNDQVGSILTVFIRRLERELGQVSLGSRVVMSQGEFVRKSIEAAAR